MSKVICLNRGSDGVFLVGILRRTDLHAKVRSCHSGLQDKGRWGRCQRVLFAFAVLVFLSLFPMWMGLFGLVDSPVFAAQDDGRDLPWQKSKKLKEPTQEDRPHPGGKRVQGGKTSWSCSQALQDPRYGDLALMMSRIHQNRELREALKGLDLDITDVSWSDTSRFHNSVIGRNMSDVRLMALTEDILGGAWPYPMPIIRLPNFTDLTVDIDLNEIFVPVGNAWGVKPFAVPLQDMLEDLASYTSWREKAPNLLLPRDRQVLVSAQASILPVPSGGQAHFVPSLYNYQSSSNHSALLVILVSNRGTSVTLIDNTRDRVPGGHGQMLFFNKGGEKSPFTAEAYENVARSRRGKKQIADLASSGQAIGGQSGVNQVMMISIPLQPPQRRRVQPYSLGHVVWRGSEENLRSAVGHGSLNQAVVDVARYTLGSFVELVSNGGQGPQQIIARDPDSPIRLDVIRFMTADDADAQILAERARVLAEQLRGIYEQGNVGSLVVDEDMRRVTRNYRPWNQHWWRKFKELHSAYFHSIPIERRGNLLGYFQELFGEGWHVRFGNREMAEKTLEGLEQGQQQSGYTP